MPDTAPDFAIIPVLDLMAGVVVHGKAGMRQSYRPIETPLGRADDPLGLARALIERAGAGILYIADLDAIAGNGDHGDLIQSLAGALSPVALWVDAGISAANQARHWCERGVRPIVGSESLGAIEQWQSIAADPDIDPVLSLDFDQSGFRGPQTLAEMPSLWPGDVIVMTLAQVGTGNGPDLEQLRLLAEIGGPSHRYFAAGGVRGVEDLDALAESGASGAAVASALHAGALPQNEIAAFRRRRRLPV